MKKIILSIIVILLVQPLCYGQEDALAVKTIKGITDKMLELISGEIDAPRDWETYRNLFLPTAQKTSLRPDGAPGRQVRTQNLEEFIRTVGPLYKRDGFEELSIGLRVHEYNGIATAFQSYYSKNLLGTYEKRGVNCYQLVYADERWWIANTVFVGEDSANRIPDEYLDEPHRGLANEVKVWEKLKTDPYRGKQDDIVFIDEKRGWFVNGYGKIFGTKDGGRSWKKLFEKKGTFFRTIAFVDENIGFAGTVGTDYFPNVSDSIPLYRTRDGGYTWEAVAYKGPYVKGLCAIDLVKEQFNNHGKIGYKNHLFAVGRVGSPANRMVSHDGGESWTSHSMQKDCKMLFDIKMMDKKTGFACAASSEAPTESNALILKTTDGGKSWKKVYQSSRPYENSWKVSFPTKDVGYATIQSNNPDPNVKQQRIIKTIDGGESWEELDLVKDHGARQFGIGFIDEQHGFVGTINSGYETKDGGKSWKAVDLGMACNKIRIYRNPEGKPYGYAIGVNVFKLNLQALSE